MSNGNNTKDPLKELLEEQMSESGKPKAFSIPSDSKIHFLFLYSSVNLLLTFAIIKNFLIKY